MLEEKKVYNLSEFISALRESQEFSPKKGEKVEYENKKNNDEAVKDILEKVKDYDGGLTDKKTRNDNPHDVDDLNKTTLDVNFAYEPSKEYKDRVRALAHGYFSPENEKTSSANENDSLNYDGNKKFYDDRKEIAGKRADAREIDKEAGLKARVIKDKMPNLYKDNTPFKNENINKMKRLHFSKTVFLNEQDMLKRIPDDMKVDGNKFFMKDAQDNEYLIECKSDDVIKDFVHTNIVSYTNKAKLQEEFNRMKQLYGYKPNAGESSINETKNVGKMLSETKKFVNQEENQAVKLMNNLFENTSTK